MELCRFSLDFYLGLWAQRWSRRCHVCSQRHTGTSQNPPGPDCWSWDERRSPRPGPGEREREEEVKDGIWELWNRVFINISPFLKFFLVGLCLLCHHFSSVFASQVFLCVFVGALCLNNIPERVTALIKIIFQKQPKIIHNSLVISHYYPHLSS